MNSQIKHLAATASAQIPLHKTAPVICPFVTLLQRNLDTFLCASNYFLMSIIFHFFVCCEIFVDYDQWNLISKKANSLRSRSETYLVMSSQVFIGHMSKVLSQLFTTCGSRIAVDPWGIFESRSHSCYASQPTFGVLLIAVAVRKACCRNLSLL